MVKLRLLLKRDALESIFFYHLHTTTTKENCIGKNVYFLIDVNITSIEIHLNLFSNISMKEFAKLYKKEQFYICIYMFVTYFKRKLK